MAKLLLGYKASAEQFGPRELVELGVMAEYYGMDSVAISDHFQPWRYHGGHAPFSLTWLSAVGERTKRIQLGTSVLTPTFRYNPAVIAQAFASLGCLYPNRIFLGIGTGEALNEIAAGLDGPWPEFRERFARLREAVHLIKQLWTGALTHFTGEYYRVTNGLLYDLPSNPPPIYIAAGGPLVAKYAGRAGDGMICTSGKGISLYTQDLLPAFNEGISQAKRHSDTAERIIEIKLSYDPDPHCALENTRFWAPLALNAQQKHSLGDPVQIEQAADSLSIEQVASRWIIASDPHQATQQIKTYIDLGFNHLIFHAPGADQQKFLQLFATDLAPRLRQLHDDNLTEHNNSMS